MDLACQDAVYLAVPPQASLVARLGYNNSEEFGVFH
jgi:hypothetical protein